ncbi:MAG: hypothetical protein DMF73_12800 [Acidobacteria bacterium]|nr:MAG: hypothetical protein DMF73_12800 [Acidobacteriota bacterium]
MHIVQFRIQDVIPNDDLEYYLSTPHWLDALTPPLESHLDRLKISVKALLDMAPPEPMAPVQPTQTTPSQAVLAPIPSVPPEGTKVLSSKRTRWIAAAAIALLVISAAVFVFALLPRLRHAATPTNASVTTTPAPAILPAGGRAGEQGRNLSFAFVDMNRIFKEYRKTKEAETKINEAKSAAKKEYDERAAAYKDKLNSVNAMQAGSSRDQGVSELKAMEHEINEFRKAREKELQDQAIASRASIVKEIEDFISQQYVKGQECMVLDLSGNSLNGVPWVVYMQALPNLTNEVISGLNYGVGAVESTARSKFVSSDRLRFGMIDMDRAFKALPETKQAGAEIKAAKDKARAELGDHPDAAAQAAKEKELQSQAADKRRPIVDRMVAEVAAVGRNHELDAVFDVSGQSLNGVPIAVVSRTIPDVTVEVIADLEGNQ